MTPHTRLPRGPALAAALALLFMVFAGPFGLLTTSAITGAPEAEALTLITKGPRFGLAVLLAVATGHIAAAMPLASSGDAGAGDAGAVAEVARFSADWALSLGLFGAHLVGLGLAGWCSGIVPRLIAALVALGGLAYLADVFGPLVWPGYALGLAAYLFFGEILLMLWLFWAALRR